MSERQDTLPKGEQVRLLKYATFLSKNKWRIAAGLALIVGILVVIGLVQSSRKRKEARALEAYERAKTAEQYKTIAADFPGTFWGSFSLIEAGNLNFEKEEFAEARKLYLQYVRSRRDSRFRAWVYNLIGATFEAQERYDDAIQYYRRAEASQWLKLQAKLNIGRCYEFKGDLEARKDPQLALEHYDVAQTYYRQLTETDPSSSRSNAAQVNPWRSQGLSRARLLREKEREVKEKESEKKVDKANR